MRPGSRAMAPGSGTWVFATGRTLADSACCDCTGSHPATCVRPSPCRRHACTGCVPAMKTSLRTCGQRGVANSPVSASISTVTMPSGASNGTHVVIFAVLVRALHEFHPDGQSAVRAFQLEIAIVVEADPHNADQLGSETREPAVARSAGLACRTED